MNVRKVSIFIVVFFSFFISVFSFGFHFPYEIWSGTFPGDYVFNGTLSIFDKVGFIPTYEYDKFKFFGGEVGPSKNSILFIRSNSDNGNTSFEDISSYDRSVGVISVPHHSTNIKKFGSSAIYLDGVDDYLTLSDSTDWDLVDVDFTMDMWIYRNGSQGAYTGLMGQFTGGCAGGTTGYSFHIVGATNVIRFCNSAITIETTDTIPDQTWTHVAAVRANNQIKLYINGIASASKSSVGTFGDSTQQFLVGSRGGYDSFKGYIDQVRFVKGEALWVNNFVPSDSEAVGKRILHYNTPDGEIIALGDGVGSLVGSSSLPTCSDGEVLQYNVTSWVCVDGSGLGSSGGSSSFVSSEVVSFQVVKTSHQNLAIGDILTWDLEVEDNENTFDLSNNKFIAPNNGTYYFHVDILSQSDATYGSYSFYKNGATTKIYGYANGDSNDYKQSTLSATLTLIAGDEIDIRTGGAAENAFGSSTSYHTSFSGFLINSGSSGSSFLNGSSEPDYDSDWFSVAIKSNYLKTHNLNTSLLRTTILYKDPNGRVWNGDGQFRTYATTPDTAGYYLLYKDDNTFDLGTANEFTFRGDNTNTYGASISNQAWTGGSYRIIAWKIYNQTHRVNDVTVTGDICIEGGNCLSSVSAGAGGGESLPIGTVMSFAQSICPTNWLETNGSIISRSIYSDLFSEIGAVYGVGDGSTTFSIPDYRGYFLRGWDNGAGNDPDSVSRTDSGDGTTGDSVGTKQVDEYDRHRHTGQMVKDSSPTGASGYTNYPVNSDGANTGISSQSYTTAYDGGSETRPKNINVLYCIKAMDSISLVEATDNSVSNYTTMGNMMMAWGTTDAIAGGAQSYTTITFPQAFISPPNVVVSSTSRNGVYCTTGQSGLNYITTTGTRIYSDTASVADVVCNWQAIGRWK